MSLTEKVFRTEYSYNAHHRFIRVVQVVLFAGVFLAGGTGVFLSLMQWQAITTTPVGLILLKEVGLIAALLMLAFFGAVNAMLMELLKKQSWGDKHLAELFAEVVKNYYDPVWQTVTDVTKTTSDTQTILRSARRLLDDHAELKGKVTVLLEVLDPAVLGRLLVQLRGVQISLEDEMRRILPQLDQSGREIQKLAEALPEGNALLQEQQRIMADVQAFIAEHASNVTVLRPAE